jgi:hypothetical protein
MQEMTTKTSLKNLKLIESFIKDSKEYVKPEEVIIEFKEILSTKEINLIINNLLIQNKIIIDPKGYII